MRQLFIGLVAEGTTDVRFLKSVIYKSALELSWQCDSMVEVFDIREIYPQGDGFAEKMLNASKVAQDKYSISMLCIHADSDSKTITDVMENKFFPFYEALKAKDDKDFCKCIVPTIPIQMIESWMLADKLLLKQLIDAEGISDSDLGIDRPPESYADPKEAINNAIRIAFEGKPKRKRDQIKISDLYEVLGNQLDLDSLRSIPSFRSFEDGMLNAFKRLNLIR